MKPVHVVYSVLTLAVLVLSSCGPESTEAAATEAPSTEPVATEAPATGAPTEPPAIPVDLAGPPMEVGSTFLAIDGSNFVAVPGGTSVQGDGSKDNPVHDVTISDFWAQQTEVTNEMYRFCAALGLCSSPSLEDNPRYADPLYANHPVVGVTYDQAATYCGAFHWRLPTEAEWEKLASWDPVKLVKLVYPWGNAGPTCDLVNVADCVGESTKITSYPKGASPYLAVDMAGNVFEWVADWYSPISAEPVQDPVGDVIGSKRSVRSTAFPSEFFLAPVARRFSAQPTDHRSDLGFRCVTLDPTYYAPFCTTLALYGAGPGGAGSCNPVDSKCFTADVQVYELDCPGGGGYGPSRVSFFSDDPSPSIPALPGACVEDAPPVPPAAHKSYKCDQSAGGFVASIESHCAYPHPGPAQCGPHYTLVGTECVWDSSGTTGDQCLPGSTYNPVNQCCTAQPGTAVNFPLCPGGTSMVEDPPGEFACVCGDKCDPATDPNCPPSDSEPVTYQFCEGPGDDGGEPCNPDVDPNCPPDGGQCPPDCTYSCDANFCGCRCPNR